MSGTLRVLMYHRVLEQEAAGRCNPSLHSATPAAFAGQMAHLARHYHPVGVEELLSRLRAGRSLPRRATLVTFDDGCRDFAEVAWPILKRHRIPATVFVPTAYPGHPEHVFWWDRLHAAVASTSRLAVRTPIGLLHLGTPAARRAALKRLQGFVKTVAHADAMRLVEELCEQMGEERRASAAASPVLGWDELRALAADGVTLAAHTRTHPALTRVSSDEARAEIRASAEDLRREIGQVLPVFAYPFGDHDERVARIARAEGFELAFTCRDGHGRLPGDDPLRLPRTGITPRSGSLVFGARLTTAGAWLDGWRHRGRPGTPGAVAKLVPGAWRTPAAPAVKVAYVMSRFPKLSETFVLNEMAACAASGIAVEVYPLLRERQAVVHPEVDAWVRRAHFEPFLSAAIVADNLRTLREQPGAYLRTWGEVLRKTWGSPNFFVGALGILPKTVRFARQMRRQGVTHVHAHFATHPALAAFIVHRLAGIPFSFTAHGSDLHVDRRMLGAKLSAAAFGVTVSRFNKEVMVRECGESMRGKVHVIHCGVDPGAFVPRSADVAGDDWRPFQVVCVASLEEVKGHRFLVDACAILRDRGVVFECHLVGEGPQRRAVERRIAAAGLEARVYLHGGQPRPFVARLLAESHAAVLASHPTRGGKREGIPVALMEAMACGLPVVATAISGIPELVQSGTTGVLVPSGDARALADALERLCRDPALRARLGRAGRARVLAAFDLHVNARALARLFAAGSATAGTEEQPARDEAPLRQAAAG